VGIAPTGGIIASIAGDPAKSIPQRSLRDQI
jgi:hypothetical protein